jgi:hypothetical protein
MMFDASQAVRQVIGLQKGAFTSWYDVVANAQDQAVSALDLMLDQSGLVPEEGRQALSSWISACQQERGRLKNFMDTGFTNLEKFIGKQTGK